MAYSGYALAPGSDPDDLIPIELILRASDPPRAPKGRFERWPVVSWTDTGLTRGDGMPIVTWEIEVLIPSEMLLLRHLCWWNDYYAPVKSANVIITTKDDDEVFRTYLAIGHWPEKLTYSRELGYYKNVEIEFTSLVEVVEE